MRGKTLLAHAMAERYRAKNTKMDGDKGERVSSATTRDGSVTPSRVVFN